MSEGLVVVNPLRQIEQDLEVVVDASEVDPREAANCSIDALNLLYQAASEHGLSMREIFFELEEHTQDIFADYLRHSDFRTARSQGVLNRQQYRGAVNMRDFVDEELPQPVS